ncbi:MAG: glycosyltransferase family 2 protein [Succinivibrio sp.]|nr:glycosyltransferase family 2 protein [Succinivibrio sp.]
MQAKISVIVAVYNAESTIGRCLDSVLSQTIKGIEIIVVDDCSTDASKKILQDYSNNNRCVNLITLDHNLGAGNARNIGINNSTGEYVSILDSDDYLKNSFVLEKLYKFAHTNNSDVVQFDYEVFNELTGKKTVIKASASGSFKKRDPSAVCSPDKCLLNSWCRLYRRAFLFNKDIKFGIGSHGEDHIFSLKSIYEAESVSYFPEICYVYTERIGSVTNSQDEGNLLIFANIDLVEAYLSSTKFWDAVSNGFYRYRLKTLKAHCLACPENFRFSFVDKAKSYLPEKEFRKFVNSLYPSIWQWLFSVTNIKDKDCIVKHKILTVLGRQFVLNSGNSTK